MSDPRDASSTKSGLPPHVWATISAIVVALIGAAVTLTTAWLSHPHASAASPAVSSPVAASSPGPIVTPAPAPQRAHEADPGLAGLTGRWKGAADLADRPSQRIEVEITAGCAPGAACGWIAVPDVPCKGRLTLVGPDPNGFEFQVDRFDASSNAQKCQPGGGEVLRALGDGTVVYTATYSGARGVLRPAT